MASTSRVKSGFAAALSLVGIFLLCGFATSSALASDFDGDGKDDVAVWRSTAGTWYINRSSDGGMAVLQWGSSAFYDVSVPGDYDGDGRTDVAVWRPASGVWYVNRSSDGGMTAVQWGMSGDTPVQGDYDGDGRTDIAIWRSSIGAWYINRSTDGGMTAMQWGSGALNDVPVPADYDGDGKTDVAVWRPAGGAWYINRSTDGGMTAMSWGSGALNDVPVPGDYDGDGWSDVAVWRPASGIWYINRSSGGGMTATQLGSGGLNDVTVPGDYDGDGKTDVAVWRPSEGVWYIDRSSGGGLATTRWGLGFLGDQAQKGPQSAVRGNKLFDIATTPAREMSKSAAFDGTNYLVGIQSGNSIGAQLISGTGEKIGSLIQTGRTGGAPSVAFDGVNYLLTWADDATNPTDLYGMFISQGGTPVGDPFVISANIAGHGFAEAVAFGGGKYLAVYPREVVAGAHWSVFARMVEPSGAVSGEIAISSGYGHMGNVAFDGDRFLAVWVENDNNAAVRGRFVAPAGTLGAEFIVNGSAARSDYPPGIVYAGGKYLVAWNDEMGVPGSGEWDILGQFLDKSGALLGSPFPIAAAAGSKVFPGLLHDGAKYLAGWLEGFGTLNVRTRFRYFDADGNPIGAEFSPAPLSARSDGRMCWFASAPNLANGRLFTAANVGTPGDPPGNFDLYTNADVMGIFYNSIVTVADLRGPWTLHAITANYAGGYAGWNYGEMTVTDNGVATVTSMTRKNGDTSVPPPFALAVTSNGTVTGLSPGYHGVMSSDRSLVVGTMNDGSGGFNLIVFERRNGDLTYSSADLQGTWNMHAIVTSDNAARTTWMRNVLTVAGSGSGNGTITNNVRGDGRVYSPAPATVSIASDGLVTIAELPSSHGVMSLDKNTIVLTYNEGSGTGDPALVFLERQSGGVSLGDIAGAWKVHILATMNQVDAFSGWAHGVFILDTYGNGGFNTSWSDGTTSAGSAPFSVSSGVVSSSLFPAFHGTVSPGKGLIVATSTDWEGSFELMVFQK